MGTPLDSICGVWVDKDAKYGEKISSFIRSQLGKTVVRADVENISCVQDSQNHVGYFVVISAESLKSKNHRFMVFLTSVLWYKYNLEINFNIVLVVVNDKNQSDDQQDKNLKTKQPSEYLPINLRTLPQVVAVPDLDDDCLHQIASKLQGPSLRADASLFIGNVGIGLAWSYFYGYLALILPKMPERIEKSDVHTKNPGKMPSSFIIVVPESCKTPAKFGDVDERFSTVGPLDDGIKKARAGQPARPYRNFVHQIKQSQEDNYYFCGEFATPILALRKMLDAGELDEAEVNKQVVLFTHTLRTIIQSHPLCKGKALVESYADDNPGLSLADELIGLISTPVEEVLPMETDQMAKESTRRSSSTECNSGSGASFPSSRGSIGSLVIFSTIAIVHGVDGTMMANSLEEFCQAVDGNYNDQISSDGLQEFAVNRQSSFEDMAPELVNPNIVDVDESLGGKTASTKLFVILTEDFKDEVEKVADALIKHPVWFPRTTFVVDMRSGIPQWLEKSGADYFETSKHTWQRVFGSLYGVASVEGEKDGRWRECKVSKQPQRQHLPVVNVAEGLAWAYYHNYLTIIGPKIAERIRANEHYSRKKMASKLFILLPYSCYSYPKLEDAEKENIESAGQLEPLVINIAGNNRNYNTFFHKISVGRESYLVCAEYCTPVLVMYEMEAEGLAGLSPMQKAAELRVFYEVLNKILTRPGAPDFCRDIKLIKYDDAQGGETLSRILVDAVKESL